MKKKNKNFKGDKQAISRFNPKASEGLSSAQVAKRVEAGLTNVSNIKTSKSLGSIFAKNIFTFFNITCLVVAVALCYVKAFSDLMFMVIVILNTAIGIFQ